MTVRTQPSRRPKLFPVSRGWMWCWLVMVWLGGASAGWADLVYIVKPKDSLTSISRRYGLPVTKLAAHNGFGTRQKLYVGQRLRIPTTLQAAVPSRPVPLSPAVLPLSALARYPGLTSQLNKIPASGRWRTIVIHHSGSAAGSVKGMDSYHRNVRHMENGLAYHFVIGNGKGMKDGEIAIGDRWRRQLDGGHLASPTQNETAIGICLVGNFDSSRPTEQQMDSLHALSAYLMRRCRLQLDDIKTHQQINVIHTRCPGKLFPTSAFLRDLERAR